MENWQKMRSKNHRIIARIIRIWIKIRYCADLLWGIEMGDDVLFAHDGFGVFITRKARIGNHVRISPLVLLGSTEKPGPRPAISDNVFIGSGAKIFDDVRVGNDMKIGADAVVNRDIPDNCTAVGVPVRIIAKKQPIKPTESQSDDFP